MSSSSITYKVIGCGGSTKPDTNIATFTYTVKAADITPTTTVGLVKFGSTVGAFTSNGAKKKKMIKS